ncbi:MAG: hypothetical protein ACOH2V_13450 [Candidatus Saccharimonadaceae bacterium]
MAKDEPKQILTVPFSRLTKVETQQLAETLIGIVEVHNPEELKIEVMSNLLAVAEKDNIAALVLRYGKHPITPLLKRPRDSRSLILSQISLKLKSVINNDPTGEDQEVLLLSTEINRFMGKIRNPKNEGEMNQAILQFVNEIGANSKFLNAVENKGFSVLFGELKTTVNTIINYLNLRAQDKSIRPKVKTPFLIKSVITSVENLIDEVRLAQLRNPTLDYGPLIDEMNEHLSIFARNINIRVLAGKRKAQEIIDNAKEEDIVVEEDVVILPANKTFHLSVELVNKNELENEIAEKLDQKKIAATNSSSMQLSVIEKEAKK